MFKLTFIAMSKTVVQTVIDFFNGQTPLAKICEVTPQAVNKWLRIGRIPVERCVAIEKASNGQITRFYLRPDIFSEQRISTDYSFPGEK